MLRLRLIAWNRETHEFDILDKGKSLLQKVASIKSSANPALDARGIPSDLSGIDRWLSDYAK
jgi:hypothetical protein